LTRRDWIAEELTSGALARITPVVDDPGNPGQVMALCRHRFGGRFLVAANGTPEPDGTHRLISVHVPEHLRDPLSAAAWTYDDESHPVRCTPTFYAHLARRT
jgi:hypothetical protein